MNTQQGMEMDMNDVTFAHLNQDKLNQIRHLEQQLSQEVNKDIVLLAYEKSANAPSGQ